MQIRTQEQLRRTVEALVETKHLIAKERRYRPDLQKPEYLASLEKHEAKLVGMINGWEAA